VIAIWVSTAETGTKVGSTLVIAGTGFWTTALTVKGSSALVPPPGAGVKTRS
jgi:hypothetical protein